MCIHTPEHPVGRHPGVQPKCWVGVGDEFCFLTHLHKQREDSVIGNASTCFFLANAYGHLIWKEYDLTCQNDCFADVGADAVGRIKTHLIN